MLSADELCFQAGSPLMGCILITTKAAQPRAAADLLRCAPQAAERQVRWAGRIKAIAIKEREMSIYVRVMFALFVLSLNSACATVFGKHLDITVDEVPVYPNAQNVVRENQGPEGFEEYIYTWSFTTSDTPDDVWQFYVDEMGREWGFYDVSSTQFDDYSLIVKSCPFYYVDMTNTVDDDGSYNIIITFGKELCR